MTISQFHKHQLLAAAVCCPGCRGALSWPDADTLQDVPVNGDLLCQRCGVVGQATNLKLNFNSKIPTLGPSGGRGLDGHLQCTDYAASIDLASPAADWQIDGDRLWSDKKGSKISLRARGQGLGLIFLKHPWAGKVAISFNGQVVETLNLLEENGSAQLWFPVCTRGLDGIVDVEVLGEKSSQSHSTQVFFLGYQILELIPSAIHSLSYSSVNRGNPYPPQFAEMLALQSPDALVLDCGSGDRSYPDARVVNFEYSQFAAPDVFADGHRLPFKDNSFDFILSQAVIEHLYNPFVAVDEIHRVLKPGGVVYAESAFMQPLHAVPYHFYNTTGWGLANLFKDFDILDSRHAGTLGQTLRWIYGLTSLRESGHGERVDALLQMVEELDANISYAELKSFASFVTITAKKRGAPRE